MSFFGDIGLRAAESLEQSVGPYVALASYKRLFAGPPEVRAKAALGALRCAVALDDEREVVELCPVWQSASESDQSATPIVCELVRRQRPRAALVLASAEEARSGSVRAAYLRRLVEGELAATIPSELVDGWRRVVAAAAKGEDAALHTHATAHLLRALFDRASQDPTFALSRAELTTLGEDAKLGLASPAEQLLLLRARLFSTSRYHRASALSAVEELARRAEGPLRQDAVLLAARHFGALFTRLDAVEIDRIAATLKHWPDPRDQHLALAQLPAWVRLLAATRAGPGSPRLQQAIDDLAAHSTEVARAVRVMRADDDAEPASRPLGTSAEETLAWLGVDASRALAREAQADAERIFQQALRSLSPEVGLPPALWLAATRALASGDAAVRRAAGAIVDQALSRTASMPPLPLVDIAGLLSSAGLSEAAGRALAEAGRWNEAGAGALLADETRRAEYEALRRGARSRPFEPLRRAPGKAASA